LVLQMKPTILPLGIAKSGTSEHVSAQVGHMDEKCPTGSIPIMRIPKKLPMTLEYMSNFKAEDIINVYPHNNTITGTTYVSNF